MGRLIGRSTLLAAAGAAAMLLVVGLVTGARPADPAPVAASTADEPSRTSEPGFVTRDGQYLAVDGRPFRFVGFNSYVLFGCGHPEEDITGREREAFFADLRPDSVVRVSLLPDTDLADFDQVVTYARRHGQRLVVALTDHHGDCGDIKKDDAFYRDGFRGAYLDWVRTVVPPYSDDPTIAMWELANEPSTSETAILRNFFDEAGGLIHELAPHQLVSSGTLQPETLGGLEAFTELSASPGIDVVSLHEYDAVGEASHHLWPALEAAEAVDKPLMVGEWGLYAGLPGAEPANDTTCFSVDERAVVAEAKLRDYLAVPEVAGALYWSFMAEGARPGNETCTLTTTASDPLAAVIQDIEIPLPD
jgi:hypothetical protein